MLTYQQAQIGARVKWQWAKRDRPIYGTITKVRYSGEVEILYDDGKEGNTYVESSNPRSRVHFVSPPPPSE